MRTMLIAYGNPSRGDDGQAFQVVRRLYAQLGLDDEKLAEGEPLPGLYTLFAQQLQPGHVQATASMQIVIFIAAHVAESG